MSISESTRQFNKDDLVIIRHPKARNWGPSNDSLALVLDTNNEMSYVVYVAGRASRVNVDPFWMDNNCLEPLGAKDGITKRDGELCEGDEDPPQQS
jgi:hypothetical protein